MDNTLFKNFLKAAQKDDRVSWDREVSWQYSEILDEIYTDVSKFQHYTLDGRFQDLLADLLKNPKYNIEGYEGFLKDIKFEFNKLVQTNVMLLPINFINKDKLKNDIKLNDDICLFLPTKLDILPVSDGVLRARQAKREKDKKETLSDHLCQYFEKALGKKLAKEHILLTKDRSFFNYPILSLKIDSVNYKVEKESGRIAQAVYSIFRMLDASKNEGSYSDRTDIRFSPAYSYVVYYKNAHDKFMEQFEEYNSLINKFDDKYYGYSYKFNFSPLLDISSVNFLKKIDIFTKSVNLYLKSTFLDTEKYNSEQLKIIKKWSNGILMFNTAYEFASIEKYDACNLILCSLLESFFLKNEGRNKQEKLLGEIKNFLIDIYESEKTEKTLSAFQNVYHYRNKIMHEGSGYEAKYVYSKRLSAFQGAYTGMRPFSRSGAVVYPNEEILNIKEILECVANILLCDKTLTTMEDTINI